MCKSKEISDFCFNSVSENSAIGYILEVDIEYPSEMHELHNDYPLAPEKLEISQNMLSKHCLSIASKYGIKIGGVIKLVPNLGNKSNSVDVPLVVFEIVGFISQYFFTL